MRAVAGVIANKFIGGADEFGVFLMFFELCPEFFSLFF